MAYVQEAALDLSRTSVKREQLSPERLPVYNGHIYHQLVRSPVPALPVPTLPVPSHLFYHIPPESANGWPPHQVSASGWPPHQVYAPAQPTSPISTYSPAQSPDFYDVESLDDDPEYQIFEKDALETMTVKNGGALLGTNPRMRRVVQQTNAEAGDSYRRQREKNNQAAKQSRDRRKLREMRLSFKVAFLKKKMAALRASLAAVVCSRCQRPCQC